MRYTTVIDITEIPLIRRSKNAQLLYLYMALKAGWHDDDRDCLDASIRSLAKDAGLTVSATRHALGQLLKTQLISRQGATWKVTKWTCLEPPTPRQKPTVQKSSHDSTITRLMDEQERKIQEYQNRVLHAVRESSLEELHTWLQELKEGRSPRHHGAQITANEKNIEWLTNVIRNRQ